MLTVDVFNLFFRVLLQKKKEKLSEQEKLVATWVNEMETKQNAIQNRLAQSEGETTDVNMRKNVLHELAPVFNQICQLIICDKLASLCVQQKLIQPKPQLKD